MNQVFHFCQLFRSGGFRQFDWGQERNFEAYGITEPPNYRFSNITFPTFIYFSDSDGISNYIDVQRLIMEIPNSQAKFLQGLDWSHADFVAGKDAKKLIYDDIVAVLNGF